MKLLGSKTIETERLLLHKTEEKDLKELWNILSLKEVNKYYLVTKINDDWEKEKKWQYKKLERASSGDVFQWTIELKDTNEVIGQISVQDGPKEEIKEIRDIGWFIDPMYQRKGYCFEAAEEVLKYMFLEVEIEKIITCAAKVNKASYLLMEKLGFKKLPTTHYVKYTLIDEEVEVYEYECTKNDFLKEYFRREKLYVTIDIDKDPYIKHISDDSILNITGESGSGKSTATEKYKDLADYVIIDTDIIYGKLKKDKYNEEIYNYLIDKYGKLPDLFNEFDIIYSSIIECSKKWHKYVIIDTALLKEIKDISLLKGDIIVLRTCVNTCYNRCIERFKKKNEDYTLDDLAEYSNRKKNIYKWYHHLNNFIDKIDKLGEENG